MEPRRLANALMTPKVFCLTVSLKPRIQGSVGVLGATNGQSPSLFEVTIPLHTRNPRSGRAWEGLDQPMQMP
jgi:hypothetical protein